MEKQNVAISLTVAEWNVVLNAIGQRPYTEIAGIVQSMNEQAKEQLQSPPVTDAE